MLEIGNYFSVAMAKGQIRLGLTIIVFVLLKDKTFPPCKVTFAFNLDPI
jgi:hypothetical protein